ncbi:hypothetical protein CC80DRAFT_150385 [Byssothecium circinans]|uniref:Uncharacterized protein n=1 Tax=Byssothecium circinans TaxID=147558 RepID=A0A6A5TKG7_9PLEO|nr:hypothetical protein CC80DRAFT_150385 [Byssothecium circinans]
MSGSRALGHRQRYQSTVDKSASSAARRSAVQKQLSGVCFIAACWADCYSYLCAGRQLRKGVWRGWSWPCSVL